MIGDLGFAGEIVTTDRVWFGFDMINSLLQHYYVLSTGLRCPSLSLHLLRSSILVDGTSNIKLEHTRTRIESHIPPDSIHRTRKPSWQG